MKTYSSDVDSAADVHQLLNPSFPYLMEPQLNKIKKRSDLYRKWFLDHPLIHNCISLILIVGFFVSDFWVLTQLPALLPWERGLIEDVGWAVVVGLIHGWLICGMVTLSVHEAASHNLLFQGKSRIILLLQTIASNMCRLSMADPDYYSVGHKAHHRYFGTDEDGSFSHFVRVKRLLLSLIPASPLMDYSDYFPWRPQERTKSRRRSAILGKVYMLTYAVFMVPEFGIAFTLVTLLMMGAWTSYVLDRLRESVEHLYMPLDKNNGTRQLGLGFWGLLLGGGPWGQPCHMSHHLAPGLPWYFQLRLHFDLKLILTESQKKVFFLTPFIGFPLLILQLLKYGHSDKLVENRPLMENE